MNEYNVRHIYIYIYIYQAVIKVIPFPNYHQSVIEIKIIRKEVFARICSNGFRVTHN